MARPTESATWATDGGTRVEPSAGEKADGFNPGARSPARKANWIVGVLSDWAAWLEELFDEDGEHIYPTPQTRRTVIHPSAAFNDTAAGWRTLALSVGGGEFTRVLETQHNLGELFFCLEDHIPSGAEVTAIRAVVKPGTTRATSGNRMELIWYEQGLNLTSFAVSGEGPEDSTRDDGTANIQQISITGLSLPMNKQIVNVAGSDIVLQHVVALFGGNDAGTNRDQVHAFVVEWTDAGLRNF